MSPAQPPSHKAQWTGVGTPWATFIEGFATSLSTSGRGLIANPTTNPTGSPTASPAPLCFLGVLSRIADLWQCRGNPLHGPAAPGSRLLTLPSILRPGFRSLSAPNNAAPAKRLPPTDRAGRGDTQPGHASCHCPERLRCSQGQKATTAESQHSWL